MSNQLQLALFGAVPALLAMAYFDRLDARRPEPRSTLRRVALAGALAAVPVIFIGQLLEMFAPAGLDGGAGGGVSSYTGALYMSFVIAAFPEEAGKMVAMLLFAWRRPEFDERMDGIVYGARAGLGFALVENVAYLLLLPGSLGEYLSIFIGRAVLAVPGHATWGGIMGYFAARRRFDRSGPGLLGGYLLAVTLHGLYDVFLFSAPVAIANGHTWVGMGVVGIPVVAYAVPAVIIALGAVTLRQFAARAVEDDDRDARVPGGPIVPSTLGRAAQPPSYPHPPMGGHPPASRDHGPVPGGVRAPAAARTGRTVIPKPDPNQ